MRRVVLFITKLVVFAALVASIIDVPLPARRRPRHRIYAIDLSASIDVPGKPESITIADAFKLVASDLNRFSPDDRMTVLVFGQDARIVYSGPLTEAPPPPPERYEGTNLQSALMSALVRQDERFDTDMILMTDGQSNRGDLESATLACRAHGLAVHVVPIGPVRPLDARLARLNAPASVPVGKTFSIEVEVESMVEGQASVRLDGPMSRSENVTLIPGARVTVVFEGLTMLREGVTSTVRLVPESFADACPENNQATITVLPQHDSKNILVVSPGSEVERILGSRPEFSVTLSAEFRDPFEFDAVILDGVEPRKFSAEQHARLRSFVQDFGGGLFALGGPEGYGLGGLSGTATEEVLPLWAFPDETLALVFVLDRSGSMGAELPDLKLRKVDAAKRAIEDGIRELRERDLVSVVVFDEAPKRLAPLAPRGEALLDELRKVSSGGGTAILPALREALNLLNPGQAARKHVVLITDGETSEVPDIKTHFGTMRQELENHKIGLSILQTGTSPSEALFNLGKPERLTGWKTVSKELRELVQESKKLVVVAPEPLKQQGKHDACAQIAAWPKPTLLNRTSPKGTADVALVSGEYPALAFGRFGRGLSAAATFAFREKWSGELANWKDLPRLIAQIVDWITPGQTGKFRLTVQAQENEWRIVAEGTENAPARLQGTVEVLPGLRSAQFDLLRVSRTRWEGRTPLEAAGTHHFKLKRYRGAYAVGHVPSPPEFARLGINLEVLDRIAAETGGLRIQKAEDFAVTPPARRATRSGRPFFLAAALVLFLLDIALSTFWK